MPKNSFFSSFFFHREPQGATESELEGDQELQEEDEERFLGTFSLFFFLQEKK